MNYTPTQRKILSHLEQNGPIKVNELGTIIQEDDTFRSVMNLLHEKVVERRNGCYWIRKEVKHG